MIPGEYLRALRPLFAREPSLAVEQGGFASPGQPCPTQQLRPRSYSRTTLPLPPPRCQAVKTTRTNCSFPRPLHRPPPPGLLPPPSWIVHSPRQLRERSPRRTSSGLEHGFASRLGALGESAWRYRKGSLCGPHGAPLGWCAESCLVMSGGERGGLGGSVAMGMPGWSRCVCSR